MALDTLLRQLVLNLLHNAIRHNAPGGWITVQTHKGNGMGAALQIINSGAMIPAENIRQLTDPFYRAAGRTAQGPTAGRGLGLSIVAAIAERHQAHLSCTARSEGGLDVRVTFPDTPTPASR